MKRIRQTIVSPAGLLLSSVLGMGDAAAQETSQPATRAMQQRVNVHLTVDTRIGDMLRHPAFAGFAPLLLPWDDRPVDEALLLKDAGTLLPYHNNVDPGIVVAALNRMIDDAATGRTVFYPVYSAAQRQADPELGQVGLFFMRGKAGAPFAVIAPGGGFQYVGSLHEGFPYAAEISGSGYNAFVLKYRVGAGGSKANADLAAALSFIFQHADQLGVSTRGYSLWGSSAGARMAAAIGSYGTARFGANETPRPSAIVMAYTAYADVGKEEPATFVVVGEHDRIAPPAVMRRRVDALARQGTRVAYHEYPGVAHGFGTGAGTSAAGWIGKAIHFWAQAIE